MELSIISFNKQLIPMETLKDCSDMMVMLSERSLGYIKIFRYSNAKMLKKITEDIIDHSLENCVVISEMERYDHISKWPSGVLKAVFH